MGRAIIGGLLGRGVQREQIAVAEPNEPGRWAAEPAATLKTTTADNAAAAWRAW